MRRGVFRHTARCRHARCARPAGTRRARGGFIGRFPFARHGGLGTLVRHAVHGAGCFAGSGVRPVRTEPRCHCPCAVGRQSGLLPDLRVAAAGAAAATRRAAARYADYCRLQIRRVRCGAQGGRGRAAVRSGRQFQGIRRFGAPAFARNPPNHRHIAACTLAATDFRAAPDTDDSRHARHRVCPPARRCRPANAAAKLLCRQPVCRCDAAASAVPTSAALPCSAPPNMRPTPGFCSACRTIWSKARRDRRCRI